MYKKSSVTHQFAFSFLALALLVFTSGCNQIPNDESEKKDAETNESVSSLEQTEMVTTPSVIATSTTTPTLRDDDEDEDEDDDKRTPVAATGTKVPVKPTPTPAPVVTPTKPAVVPSAPAPVATGLTGSFSETASYGTPAGTQTVTFAFKLSAGTITGVTLTGAPRDSTSKEYTNAFMGGIAPMVVGKKLSAIGTFSRVSGASLTVNAFNKAIAQLKAKA